MKEAGVRVGKSATGDFSAGEMQMSTRREKPWVTGDLE